MMYHNTLALLKTYNNGIPVVPALDIEEFLGKRLWERDQEVSEYLQALKDGTRFLGLVRRGIKIVQRTKDEGIVSGDLAAIRAYNLARNAFLQYPNKYSKNFEEVIDIAQDIILYFINFNQGSVDNVDENDLSITRDLFLAISYIPIRANEFAFA